MIEQIIDFLVKHWLLSSAFVVVVIMLLLEEFKGKQGGSSLSPQEATYLINREHAVVIDLRDHASFESGHIVGAMSIPHSDLLNSIGKIKKYQQKPIILLCSNGQISASMVGKLRSQGFVKTYAIAGGVQAWKNAELPLTKT